MTFSRALLIPVLVGLMAIPGCALLQSRLANPMTEIDNSLNRWLGKSKDERIRRAGPPAQCAKLSNGDEACSWVRGGVQNAAVDCPPDVVYGGHRCRGGGGSSWEHHVILVYDQNGIAQEWNYWGSLGERSSKSSQPAQNNVSTANRLDPKRAAIPVSVEGQSLPIVGLSLGQSRQTVHEEIVRKGGRLLAHHQEPERDEYDSSGWQDGSSSVVAFYTSTGQLTVIGNKYSVANQEEGIYLAGQLRQTIEDAFGAAQRHSDGPWPFSYTWETPNTVALIAGEGESPLTVFTVFSIPQAEAKLEMKTSAPLH